MAETTAYWKIWRMTLYEKLHTEKIQFLGSFEGYFEVRIGLKQDFNQAPLDS
jgi:hypothetical protein